MNQLKSGKYIAEKRKERNLTQKELTQKLSISDKAVSKWETEKCMPDNSIMIQLCNLLGITANELLSGEPISHEDYSRKAEKNIMNLIQKVDTLQIKTCILVVKQTMISLILAGGISGVIGVISILHKMVDVAKLGPSLAVIILSIFYSWILTLLLLPVKIKLEKKLLNN